MGGAFLVAFGSVLIKDYFDDTLKSPDQIEQEEIKLPTWIPYVRHAGEDYFRKHEPGVSGQTDSTLRESFNIFIVCIQFLS